MTHHEPDRVPLDYWAVPETTERLLEVLGLQDKDQLLQELGVDVRYVRPCYTEGDYEEQLDGSLHRRLPDGTFVDIWGVVRKRVSWGMGSYLEVVKSPLAEAESVGEIEDHPWPDPRTFDFHSVSEQCYRYRESAIICTGDRLTTRASVFKLAMYLRGMDRLLMDLVVNPGLVEALLGKLLEFHLEYNRRIFEAAADHIDIFMLGDDFGTENGPMISPDMFRRFFKPALKELVQVGKEFDLKVMLHSCGGVRELIPDFIDIGLDILNPIQTQAKGMDPKRLKADFGRDLCFHGSVDVQRTLPFGSTEQVRAEVRERIETLGQGGGFILAPAHNLQPDIPVENILAMYQAASV